MCNNLEKRIKSVFSVLQGKVKIHQFYIFLKKKKKKKHRKTYLYNAFKQFSFITSYTANTSGLYVVSLGPVQFSRVQDFQVDK